MWKEGANPVEIRTRAKNPNGKRAGSLRYRDVDSRFALSFA
jgi:hypothetical protein